MMTRFMSCAVISLLLVAASIPASGRSARDVLLDESALCNYSAATSTGKTHRLDIFSNSSYHTLSRGKRFPIYHSGEARPGTLYAVFDVRRQILGVYTKYYTWGSVTLRKIGAPITSLPNLDLSDVGTAAGIKIGTSDRALSRLPGPKAIWTCGSARQVLYRNNCDSTQYSIIGGRVVTIKSGYGGC